MSGQEFTLPVPVTLEQLKKGDRKAIRAAFDALYEHRYAHHSPDEPVEMVNIRLAAIGKRPKLRFPRARSAAPPQRPRAAATSTWRDARKPVPCPVYQRGDLGAGARIKGPALDRGARHHDRAVRRRSLHCRAIWRADHRRRRRMMAKPALQGPSPSRASALRRRTARPGHARSHPQRAARPSPTRWPPTCSAPPTT